MQEPFVQDFVYNFGASVAYVCEDGDYYFKHDREATNITITCLNSGEWDVPLTWQSCQRPEGEGYIFVRFYGL